MARPRLPGLVALAFAWSLLAPPPAPAAEELVDAIAAQVGSDIVLVSEVMQIVAPVEAQMRQQGAPDIEIAKLRADGLERMIEWKLIERVVRQTELYATDAEVESAIDGIAEENAMDRAALEENVTSHGLSLEDYKGQIKREIERSKVLGALVSSKVRVEEDAVRRLYEERYAEQPEGGDQVHLNQYLVLAGEEHGRDQGQACSLVAQARAAVLAGTPFGEAAVEANALGPGGDIGWIHTGELSAWMAEVVKDLEPGQVSEVVVRPFGCSLLLLVDRQSYARVTYDMAKPALEREIRAMSENAQYRDWLEELRDNTYIDRRGYFAEAAQLLGPALRPPGTE